MYRINANYYEVRPQSKMLLGQRGENLVREVVYDMSQMIADNGDGTFEWVFKDPLGTIYKVSNQYREGNKAIWILVDIDMQYAGTGHCELWFYPEREGAIDKTVTITTYTAPSIGISGSERDPYEDILRTINEERYLSTEAAATATSQAAIATNAAAEAIEAKNSALNSAALASTAASSAAQSAETASGQATIAEEAAERAERLVNEAIPNAIGGAY